MILYQNKHNFMIDINQKLGIYVKLYIYHILVDNIANILPCNKTLNFV